MGTDQIKVIEGERIRKNKINTTPIMLFFMTGLLVTIICYPPVFYKIKALSMDFIIFTRNTYGNHIVDKLINLTSAVLDKYGVASAVVLAQILLSPPRLQVLMVTLTISVSVNTIIKMVLKDPRPFFVSDDFFPVK